MTMNIPFTTHNAYQLDSLAFAYIRDAKGNIIARIQAETKEKADEIAKAICEWSKNATISRA